MGTPMTDKLQLRSQPGSKDYFLKRGSTRSWSDAAETSVKSLKGAKVRSLSRGAWGVGEVEWDTGQVGGDGRKWVGVRYGEHLVHFEREDLVVV